VLTAVGGCIRTCLQDVENSNSDDVNKMSVEWKERTKNKIITMSWVIKGIATAGNPTLNEWMQKVSFSFCGLDV